MSGHFMKYVGFTVICSMSGIGYLKYLKYTQENQEIQQLIDSNKISQYLLQLNEDNSYQMDDIMDQFEKSYNQPVINQYKQTVLQFAKGKVLETCAGTNRNLRFYNPGTDLTLIDWSPNMVAAGSVKQSPVLDYTYEIGDVTNLPFKDDQFDSVVDIFGLEYVEKPQKALQQIMRVCKKNGRIILMNQGLSSFLEFHYFQNAKWRQNLFQRGLFSNRNWQKLIRETNLQIESHERKKNGKIYVFILNNNKGKKPENRSAEVS